MKPQGSPAGPPAAPGLAFSLHDDTIPADAARVVDQGLGDANAAAASLHEVRALACFVRDEACTVVGGAVGRTWGACCELQQLWVAPEHRLAGIGAALLRRFEAQTAVRGCRDFYLETLSFQAPALYRALGYDTVYRNAVFPHGIVKHAMVKPAGTAPPTRSAGPAAAVWPRRCWQRRKTTAGRSGSACWWLNTEAGSTAEGIYGHLGWRHGGSIPATRSRPTAGRTPRSTCTRHWPSNDAVPARAP